MKKHQELAKNMTHKDLEKCISEIIEFHDTGILKSAGLVRAFADKLVESIGESIIPYKIRMSEEMLLFEGAKRFAKEMTKKELKEEADHNNELYRKGELR